ncbi:GT14-family glycosyltransferase [Chara braunii]|uniref:GT14-family glycosyltransferase n=1 Tax=Chara braunii TaxID=69332 RepID=A0A388LBI1_CHABU|nr:GT14-family glycosyltransferase [Chara braunii]|eukprot:GBG79661.1 GT14-family glycosyltransferase [Chara braunii]
MMCDRCRVDVAGLSENLPTTKGDEGEERLVVKKQIKMEVNLRWLKYVVAFSIVSIGLFVASTVHFGPGPFEILNPNNVGSVNRPWTGTRSSSSSSLSGISLASRLVFSSSDAGSDTGVGGVDGPPLAELPRIAYFLTGSIGDGNRMKRLLLALYHPHNQYLLHMDRASPASERLDLARYVAFHPIFLTVGNVRFIVKSNLVTYRGPTMIATTLHGMSVFLRKKSKWDWFVNLSASDYPLITQDDFLHVLSSVPRGLNFLEHSGEIADWKMEQRVHSMVVDPAIYRSSKSDLIFVKETRATPNAFRIFQGSAWMMLSRDFCEHLIYGWDNLPRLALMYFANVVTSPEAYFHTVICNSRQHFNTTVNTDLHFVAWDNPPKQHPLSLNSSFYKGMINSSAPFARKFEENETLLDTIDAELLRGRRRAHVVVGGWCAGNETEGGGLVATASAEVGASSSASGGEARAGNFHADPCSVIGDPVALRPGEGAKRFDKLIQRVLEPTYFRGRQCV